MSTATKLNSIDDWVRWSRQLKYQCTKRQIWEHVRPTERVPWKPEQCPTGSDPGEQELYYYYYDKQRKAKWEVRDWMEKTICDRFMIVLERLDNVDPDSCYDALATRLNVTANTLHAATQRNYISAMQSMARRPHNFDDWVDEWFIVMTDCRDENLWEANTPFVWWRTLSKHIDNVLPGWSNIYEIAHREAITDGSLTFEDVMSGLRLRIKRLPTIVNSNHDKWNEDPEEDPADVVLRL